MLRKGVTTEQRDSIRGVGSMNLEAILALLAEAILRVNGLNKPFNEKTKEAAANLQVKKDLEAAQQKVAKLKGELKTTKAELDKLQNIDRDTTSLRRQVENLKKKLANQEEQLRSKYEKRAEEEKCKLIEENEADCITRMQMAWKALFPNDDYSIWEYHYEQATNALDRVAGAGGGSGGGAGGGWSLGWGASGSS